MDAAFEFAVNDLNMVFTFRLMTDGHNILDRLFVDILTEKCQLIHKHIRESKDNLMMVAIVTNTVATIKFYDHELDDSQLLHGTISKLPDMEDQLYQLWFEVHDLLQDYTIDDHAAELHSIDTYYSNLEFDEMLQADLM